MRALFLSNYHNVPSGGRAVLYDSVEILRDHGVDSGVVFPRCVPRPREDTAHLSVGWLPIRKHSLRRRFKQALSQRRDWARDQMLGEISLNSEDILFVPDASILAVSKTQLPCRKVLFSQNPFNQMDQHIAAMDAGLNPVSIFECVWSIAEVTDNMSDLLGYPRRCKVRVSAHLDKFAYTPSKKHKIAYMPRKRPEEAKVIAEALKRRGRIADFELIEIDNMPLDDVAVLMREALIFVSLLKNEALGFPAMEAMATGAITVGYTGLGTEEYFTDRTGIPVTEGDTFGIVQAVESVVADYVSNPAIWDEKRQAAAQFVRKKYGRQRFENDVVKAWKSLVKKRA